jgi:hypothetical protein
MAVSIPTNAVIPKAMMSMVRMLRSQWLRTEVKAIRMFSANTPPGLIIEQKLRRCKGIEKGFVAVGEMVFL